MQRFRIGVVGCGNISTQYLKAYSNFPVLEIAALSDMNMDVAEAKATEFDLPTKPLDVLFADPAIDIILNLTVPKAHVEVGLRALAAGKHVYGEKPLGIDFAEARTLIAEADAKGLRVGSAPDTFLGGAHQTARKLLDEGVIGRAVAGTAVFMCPGHERWHPNPAFYYEIGGGPMLDMGPYYITDLVNLLGPVARVTGFSSMPRETRTITSPARNGEVIPVHVPTHVAGTLLFANGAVVQVTMSFDVPLHRHTPIELYGTEGSMQVPDPNRFGGDVEIARTGGGWETVPNELPYADGLYRSIGLADMALAIAEGRPHRASGALALHVLEVMEAFGRSSDAGRAIDMTTTVERPAPIATSLKGGVLA